MNIKLHTVISDLLGKTGMSMVRSILDGKDPKDLIRFKDPRIKSTDEEIKKSLKEYIKKSIFLCWDQPGPKHKNYRREDPEQQNEEEREPCRPDTADGCKHLVNL